MDPEILLVADDMTGALDASAPLAGEGCSVAVRPGAGRVPTSLARPVAVRAVNCGTRHAPPRVAARVVRAAVGALAGPGTLVVKKTDSMLRGNLGAELAATLAATGAVVLHFLPALPSQGRTTVGGVQYCGGVPVGEAERDPFGPPASSEVAAVLAGQCDLPVTCVPLGGEVPRGFRGIAVHDAVTQRDMERSLGAVLAGEARPVLAGCSGLTAALAALRGSPGLPPWSMGPDEGLLWLCGSLNPVSRAQCARASVDGAGVVPLPGGAKTDRRWLATPEGRVTTTRVAASWRSRRATVVDATAAAAGHAPAGAREAVSGRLGRFGAAVVREAAPAPGPLMVSGGDVLAAVLEALGVREIRPSGEALPGVIASSAPSPLGALSVLSKSGGFGAPGIVARLVGRDAPRATAPAVGKEC